jgi:hypothetical protein
MPVRLDAWSLAVSDLCAGELARLRGAITGALDEAEVIARLGPPLARHEQKTMRLLARLEYSPAALPDADFLDEEDIRITSEVHFVTRSGVPRTSGKLAVRSEHRSESPDERAGASFRAAAEGVRERLERVFGPAVPRRGGPPKHGRAYACYDFPSTQDLIVSCEGGIRWGVPSIEIFVAPRED